MTSQEFCYWLHGFFEISGKAEVTSEQAQIVKDHLALVFTKVTPARADLDYGDALRRSQQGMGQQTNPVGMRANLIC